RLSFAQPGLRRRLIGGVRRAMDNRQPQRRGAPDDASINLRSATATVVAAALGAIAGGLAASKLPGDKFIWTGFVLAPLLVLLEVFFKHLVALFSGNANVARLMLVSALVAVFCVYCFAF